MKKVLLTGFVVTTLCLVAGVAIADECKPVHVRIGLSTYLDPCVYQEIDFLYCIDAPLKGTLRGTWHYYGEETNGVFWPPLNDDGDPIFDPAPYSAMVAGWALGLIETNKGELYVQDNYLWNFNTITDNHLPFVTLMNVTGGSGMYDGASGWLGVIADDSGNWRGFMKGVICTP